MIGQVKAWSPPFSKLAILSYQIWDFPRKGATLPLVSTSDLSPNSSLVPAVHPYGCNLLPLYQLLQQLWPFHFLLPENGVHIMVLLQEGVVLSLQSTVCPLHLRDPGLQLPIVSIHTQQTTLHFAQSDPDRKSTSATVLSMRSTVQRVH